MRTVQYILISYCALSILSLLNKGVRHLYIECLDNLYEMCFVRLNRRFRKVRIKDYLYLPLHVLGEITVISIRFILAPIAIIWHLPTGGFKYEYLWTPYWKLKSHPIKEEYITSRRIIKINKNLPFTPDANQVIYVESHFNNDLNKYIKENYGKICKLFAEIGYHFIYLPKVIESISNESVNYLFPVYCKDDITINRIDTQTIIDYFLSYSDEEVPLSSGLLRFYEERDNHFIFTYYKFTNFEDAEIWEQLRAYLSCVGFGGKQDKLYHLETTEINPEDEADYNFNSQARQLIAEIKERIETLKQIGINELVLKKLFAIEGKPELSRLLINSKYEIILPDYNNMEITMYPLPKAVFFLFLNHPEGILFKNLPDHRDELIVIYKKISGQENIESMEKSIDDVVNPTLNSINEKCSRIRESFISKFDESIAQNYFITGERATPKKIILDRDLIILEGKF